MSPISALLLVRLINGYSVLCTITGVIEVNMGMKWGGRVGECTIPQYT